MVENILTSTFIIFFINTTHGKYTHHEHTHKIFHIENTFSGTLKH